MVNVCDAWLAEPSSIVVATRTWGQESLVPEIKSPQSLINDVVWANVLKELTANTANNNHKKLVRHISSAAHFNVDSEEKVSSQFYFARAKNNQFNYTTNPSFVDTNGNVNITSFVDNPTTYITTVGMYNDSGDLVAVAKLSQPVTKDFTKETLIRVKLDY